jgi:NADP-dependent 3-hydroxy acid dehydrogenase YdfG
MIKAMTPTELRGRVKVAIVTGASQGIGAGVAAALVRGGYAVVGTSRSIAPSAQPGFLTVPGDIAAPETAQHVVDQALDRFGRIDTLVNNAGIFISKPFTDYKPDDYDVMTAVNLAGFFHIPQRAIAQMVAQGGGHVVSVTTSLVDHVLSGLRLGDVTRHGEEAPLRGGRDRTRGPDDRVPSADQGGCNACADALRGAGDDRDLHATR